MHQAIHNDRLWFQQHPKAMVRFRKQIQDEFEQLKKHGETPPEFRPSFSKANAPLQWVAVVDLMQLLRSNSEHQNSPKLRLRLQIPTMHRRADQQAAKQELIKAIAFELLEQAESTVETSNFLREDEDDQRGIGPLAA